MSTVRTRFAPSPTGFLHAGNYRTAVFSYLFAAKQGGSFVLRIEDTDRARSKPAYEQNILETLAWLDLPYETAYRQSEHAPRHRELLEKLIAGGAAYRSKEASRAEGGGSVEVIRFKNPGGEVSFADLIRGDISIDVTDLGDFVIARSLSEPLFHFAVVADDAEEEITHVIRGEDHISNTPRQILIQRALGVPTPAYAHLPLILGPDRSKLSKRGGARALTDYRDEGVMPEAMLNYLAFLGFNPGGDREYLTRDELVEAFDLSRVQKGAAIFDETKLFSVNQYWMRSLPDDEFARRAALTLDGEGRALRALPLLKERARTFKEARSILEGELAFLFAPPALDRDALLRKEPSERAGLTTRSLAELLSLIKELPETVSAEAVKERLMPFADAAEAAGKGGRGAVLWPLRYALSGAERSPDPFSLVMILGSAESARRIEAALRVLGS